MTTRGYHISAMDTIPAKMRSLVMSRIRGKNTKPEMVARRLIHGMGYRFRLHVRALPGVPDLVFPSRKKVILVNGCFWHRHACRRGRSTPTTRRGFWNRKFDANRRRDRRAQDRLRRMGWQVLVVWECQLHPKKVQSLTARLRRFLDAPTPLV